MLYQGAKLQLLSAGLEEAAIPGDLIRKHLWENMPSSVIAQQAGSHTASLLLEHIKSPLSCYHSNTVRQLLIHHYLYLHTSGFHVQP